MGSNIENGKICYMEIPAEDIQISSSFYKNVFGWKLRERGDGRIAFDDRENGVSGTWVHGRAVSSSPGILIYIMVSNMDETIRKIELQGGKITQPVGMDAPVVTARFRDPAGNIIGLYQE